MLGPRLRECSTLLLDCGEREIDRIMPWPDDLKLQSSMTLFAEAAGDGLAEDKTLFLAVLDRFFAGKLDSNTLRLLSR